MNSTFCIHLLQFNDSLIYTSYVGSPSVSSGLKLHHELPLLRMEVRLPAAANSDTDFNVISTARSFTLAASSVQVRDEWMSALNQAINEYQSNLSTFEIAQNLSPSTELHFGQQVKSFVIRSHPLIIIVPTMGVIHGVDMGTCPPYFYTIEEDF